jgi:death-on-curing protein
MTSAPTFLTIDEVLALHASRIELYGGSQGVRDRGLLESALAQPSQKFGGEYLHPDWASMAAAYLYHLVQNHPFIDGNKRTGAAAAIVFLKMNDVELRPDEQALGDVVLRVADGKVTKEEITQYFREHVGAA